MEKSITCPICNDELEKGYICATAPISNTLALELYWSKKKSLQLLGFPRSKDLIIRGGGVSGEVCADAFRCPKDKTIVLTQ